MLNISYWEMEMVIGSVSCNDHYVKRGDIMWNKTKVTYSGNVMITKKNENAVRFKCRRSIS